MVFFYRLGRAAALTFALILLLAAVVFSYGYIKRFPKIYGFIHPSVPVPNEAVHDLEYESQGTISAHLLNDETDKLAAESKIVLQRVYGLCNHILTEELDNYYAGKTKEELTEMFSDWRMVSFSPERAVFLVEIDSYCPDHYLVKHEDGLMVIYRPDKEGIMLVVEAAEIPVERLSPDLLQELEEGIVVYGMEGVENIFESLGS